MIWSDEYLSRLIDDAERDIVSKTSPIFTRFSIGVTAGVRGATLPESTMGIVQVTWKGDRLYPLYQSEMIEKSHIYRTEQGDPKYYLYSNEGLRNIKFFPVPNETIAADDSGIYGSDIANRVIISAYKWPTVEQANYDIPDYIARRTVKAYVLWRSFMAEGKGQNMRAAKYYEEKYKVLISIYKLVKETLTDAKVTIKDARPRGVKPAPPRLAYNFVVTP